MKTVLSIAFILLCAFASQGQILYTSGIGPPLSAACMTGNVTYKDDASGNLWDCVAGAWHLTPNSTGAQTSVVAAIAAGGGVGPVGPQGPPGAASTVPGPQGPAGASSTVPGPQGPIGNTGAASTVPGPQGLTGDAGPAGAASTVPGPQGIQGIPGATGSTGAQGPQGNVGAQGLVGPTGNTGLTGNTGPQGAVGNAGATGPQGPIGNTGSQGAAGTNGAQGIQGLPGTNGTNGATGAQGPQGIQGVPGPGGYRTLITLGADIPSTAAITFQNITGLSFAVTAGTNYRFYAVILYTTSVATIGTRVSLSGPAVTHLAYTTRAGLSNVGSAAAEWQNYQSTVDAGTVATSSVSTTAGNVIVLEGIIRPSASGTVQLRFAPETATSAGITIKSGSTLEVW